MLSRIIKLARIDHWVKNVVVLMPVIFSLNMTDKMAWGYALAAAVAFCFASSFAYTINDIKDADADRKHPRKKDRPIASGDMRKLSVDLIQRGKYQPRRDLQADALEELAASIRSQGVLQPIVVRLAGEDRYEIIAGERRWRAAQLAGLDKIPAIVREVPDEAAIAMALIENIQREDLNALEEAAALGRLRDEFSLTQQEVADAVGKSRATIANLLRLLSLRDDVKKLLERAIETS